MTKSIQYFLLGVIIVFAATLRVQVVSTTVVDNPVRADAAQYYFGALNIQRWNVFSSEAPSQSPPKPDAFRPPVVSAILTFFASIPPTEKMLFHFNLFQACLDTLTVLIVFFIFYQFSGYWQALCSALLAAISPHLISMTTYMLTETTFTFILACGLCALCVSFKRDSLIFALIGGMILGLSALTRETTEYLPIFLCAVMFWFVERRVFFRLLVPALVMALVVMALWKIRNFFAIGHFSDPALAINTIHHGMYPDMMYENDPRSFSMPYRFDPESSKMKNLSDVLYILWQRACAEPGRYIYWFVIGKPLAFLQWSLQDGGGDVFIYPVKYSPYFNKNLFGVTHFVCYWLYFPLTAFAWVGGCLAVWRPMWLGLKEDARLPVLLIMAVFVYFLAVHMVGFPLARYSVPLRPYFYGLGLVTIVALIRQVMFKPKISEKSS